MYVVTGTGSQAVGNTPEEAARAFLAAGGRGRAVLYRTPQGVTPANVADALRQWHRVVPASAGSDDSWLEVPPSRELWDLGIDWGERPPRLCPGYRAAVDAGVVRPPAANPPEPLPGLAAALQTKLLFIGTGVLFVLILPVATVGGTTAVIVMFALMAAWFFGIRRSLERRKWQELDAGYITVPIAESSRGESSGPRWDYRGTWQLTANGEVRAEPDRSLDGPGYYPSPSDVPGRLNLWTGVGWVPEFRAYDPAVLERSWDVSP